VLTNYTYYFIGKVKGGGVLEMLTALKSSPTVPAIED
jgi:hypothetical protein